MVHKLLGSLTALCACMVFLCVGASAMEIYVTMPDTAVIKLEVESGDSIDNVKIKLQEKKGIPPARQQLFYNNKFLANGRTLADYYIQKESKLDLLTKPEIEVSSNWELISVIADEAVPAIKLTADITIDTTLNIDRAVTLDLNGHVLRYKNNTEKGSVIKVASGGDLTIRDSAPATTHYYSVNPDTSLWTVLSDNTNAAGSILGGIITGGTGTQVFGFYNGGGVYVAPGGTLTMNGGSIVGCSANTYTKSDLSFGGGVCLRSSTTDSNVGTFTMNGGSIIGCTAGGGGGGVCVISGCNFTMNTGASIRSCTAAMGGGVYNSMGIDDLLGTFTLNGGTIQSCKATGRGGGGVSNSGEFIMQSGTIEGCTSVNIPNESNKNSGILNSGQFTMRGGTVADNVTNSGTISADGGKITGAVTNGIDNEPGKITGTNGASGRTEFTNTVTNHDNSTISGFGTFTGEVINNGTITGFGIFTGSVTNNGGKIAGFCDFDQATLNGYLTVTFDPDNGELNSTQQVPWIKEGAPLTEPSPAPTKDGYTFKGWYRGYGWDKWDFDTDKVCYTMTLTAKWTANPSAPAYAVSAPTTENGKITVSLKNASRGDTVTITVKPEAGFKLAALTVTDKDGNVLTLTDKGDGTYTFTMPAGEIEVNAVFVEEVETSPFTDVSNKAYYYEAVKWAQEKDITGGIGNNLFGSNQPCTRAQIVTFLWRAAGSPEPEGSTAGMTDVAAGSYYEKAVAWAIENGITNGTTATTFSPNDTCTRAQAVTLLARALNAKADSKAEFSDVPTKSYFADAVAWAAANGVTTGIGGGLFGPDNDCTRAQIVTFLWRAYTK